MTLSLCQGVNINRCRYLSFPFSLTFALAKYDYLKILAKAVTSLTADPGDISLDRLRSVLNELTSCAAAETTDAKLLGCIEPEALDPVGVDAPDPPADNIGFNPAALRSATSR